MQGHRTTNLKLIFVQLIQRQQIGPSACQPTYRSATVYIYASVHPVSQPTHQFRQTRTIIPKKILGTHYQQTDRKPNDSRRMEFKPT